MLPGSSIVSSSETWSPSPEIDQSSSSAAIDEREMSLSESSSSSTVIPTCVGDLLVGRRAAEPRLELADRALDLARARPHRARHPVERAQLVDDRAADARDRVGLELDVAVGVEAVDRADQPEQPVRDEVAVVDVRGQPRSEPAGDVLHERRVAEDQLIAQRLLARLPVLEPQAQRLGVASHRPENTTYLKILLSAAHANEPIHNASAAAATAITHLSALRRGDARSRRNRA